MPIFVVAASEDASQYGAFVQNGRPIPPDRFQLARYKNFTPLALEKLWAILRHEQWDVKRHRLEQVSHTEGGESWLFRFPDELVHRLSALNEADLHQVADDWVNPRRCQGMRMGFAGRAGFEAIGSSGADAWEKLVLVGLIVSDGAKTAPV